MNIILIYELAELKRTYRELISFLHSNGNQ
jgi:hypothetical protein